MERIGAVAFEGEQLLVLEGDYILARLDRAEVRSLRVEQRPSFKHPVLGAVLGLALLVPGGAFVGIAPMAATKGVVYVLVGASISVIAGVSLLWGVITRKDIPFLVAVTERGESIYALDQPVTAELSSALDRFVARP
ncbi:MAG: hypothetical protein QM765_32415 [Myxococcales bacterium]